MNATISMTNKLRGTVSMANSKINGGASPYPKTAGPAAIITITDGAENTPLKSAVVNIEPVQDLHGYDYPWPGGGGKNLFNFDQAVGTTTIETEAIQLEPGTYYVYVAGKAANWNSYVQISTNGTSFSNITTDATSQTAYADYAMGYNIKKCILTVVSPIYARQRLQVNANVQNDRVAVMYTKDGTGYSSVPATLTYSTTEWKAIYQPYSNICPISGWSEVKVWVKPTYDTTLTPTATIPLGRTVYGGTVDVLAGEGESVLGHATYDGTDSSGWTRTAAYGSVTRFDKSISGLKPASGNNLKCNQLKVGTIGTANLVCCNVHGNTPVLRIQIPTSLLASDNVAGLMTYFQSHPLQVCYELATPQEYDVSPQTIKTLLGVNSIWADAGNMEIEYYPAAASIVAVQNRSTKAYVSIPLGMIRYETYQITPQQTIDLDSYRSENGNLLRNPVATKCKIEFNTPLMTDSEWAEIWNIIKAGFNNNTERKLKLRYYDTLSATYKTGYFYVPDVQTTIRNIDEGAGVINYNEIRIAFIEY